MTIFTLFAFINGFSATIFGIWVFSKNPRKAINKIFGLMTAVFAIWSFSYAFWQMSSSMESALFWVRILSIGSTFIPVTFLHWVLVLLGAQKKRKKILIFAYIFSFILAAFSFTPLYVKTVIPRLSFSWWPVPGILYNFYLILGYLGIVGYACYELLKTYKTSTGHIHEQIKYILLAVIIGFGGGAFNFPLWYGVPILPFGNFFVCLYPLILSYSILKYRLMDIRFALGRTSVYFLSFVSVAGIGVLLMFLNNLLTEPLSFNIFFPLSIIIAVVFYQFFFKIYEKLAAKYFYYTLYSYKKVLTGLGRKLTGILDLNKLSNVLATTLIETMKLDRAVILQREETGGYHILKNIGFNEENGISLVKDNFLTRYLQKRKKFLVYEELSLVQRDSQDERQKKELEKLKNNMKRIQADVCLPLFWEQEIIGMIILGRKISRESYYKEDLELLNFLSSQASIAFQNAHLYNQVQGLSENLQEKVNEQTKKLRTAYEELKRVDEAKTEFISMASHQLRTPLTAIKGYISMLLDGDYGELGQKKGDIISKVFQSNERLIQIVGDLLNISRIELGQIKLDKTKVNISDLVVSCCEEMTTRAKETNLTLVFKKPKKAIPQLNIDKLKIRQVILNIIDNAIRYTKKGGIEISLQKKDESVLIIVKDTGVGLKKEEKKTIFGDFSRGSAGINLFIEGAGLGLSVAKKYLKLHKGKIWAESKGENKGSTFYIELPLN